MAEKRRDHRGRILRNGEVQLSDGRYRFKYVDETGRERYIYSWRLNYNDKTPKGKRKKLSLREMEKNIQINQLDHIKTNDGNITVLELTKKYLATKTGIRVNTTFVYNTVINLLQKDPFGSKRINTVKLSDVKGWLVKLQKVDKKCYSSIHLIQGVLRPAFQLAVDDDLIRKNPFQFQLTEVVVNDSVRREAISRDQEREFLKFVKEDPHYCKYYEGIYILFKTGLRISEFCGLTVSDIDFEKHTINVDHQLQKRAKIGYYIQKTKTENGTRILPMTKDVENCFKKIIENRNPPKVEPMIDGKTGFLYFDKNGNVCHSFHWEHYFEYIVQKYNKINKVQMPKITPHVCRHTYCSNMAKSGMNPKTLQYLMGHSDISITLNIYTHINYEDAKKEITKIYTKQFNERNVQ